MLLTILVVLLLFSLIGGGVAFNRYGYVGWSPAMVLIAVLLVLWLMGWRGFR